jgi:hypothetical protein
MIGAPTAIGEGATTDMTGLTSCGVSSSFDDSIVPVTLPPHIGAAVDFGSGR